MIIFVKKNGRLGNNLFQYFFGKILASELNCELITEFELPSEFGLKNFYKNKVSLEKVVLLREKYNVYNPKDSMRFKLMLNEVEILKDLNTIISEIKKEIDPKIIDLETTEKLKKENEELRASILSKDSQVNVGGGKSVVNNENKPVPTDKDIMLASKYFNGDIDRFMKYKVKS
jgi:hypothetical protein